MTSFEQKHLKLVRRCKNIFSSWTREKIFIKFLFDPTCNSPWAGFFFEFQRTINNPPLRISVQKTLVGLLYSYVFFYNFTRTKNICGALDWKTRGIILYNFSLIFFRSLWVKNHLHETNKNGFLRTVVHKVSRLSKKFSIEYF